MREDFNSLKPEQLEALKTLLGKSYTAESSEFADWFDGKKIDEIALCEDLIRKKERKCIHGRLYDLDGEIEEESKGGQLYPFFVVALGTGMRMGESSD